MRLQTILSSNKLKKINRPYLLGLFCFALIIRILYAFYLQKFISGKYIFEYGDTYTFIDTFQNLLNNGSFCINPNHEDSCFYRLPTYPFFLGFFYALFSPYEWLGIALTQAVFDSLTCVIGVCILAKLGVANFTLWLSGFILSLYPLAIFWVPIQYPEILGLFLVACCIYSVLILPNWKISAALSSAFLLLAFWCKQYALVFLPFIIFLVFARDQNTPRLKYFFIFSCLFLALHSTWVLRNYLNYNKIVLISAQTTGILGYLSDMKEAIRFTKLISEDNTALIDDIANKGVLILPDHEFYRRHEAEINYIVGRAFSCGPSFLFRRGIPQDEIYSQVLCEKEVAQGFEALRSNARQQMRFFDYYRTSFEGLEKSFLKISFSPSKASEAIQLIVFSARFIIIFFAFAYVFLLLNRRHFFFWMFAVFSWSSAVVVFSFAYHVEMRYLLWVDYPLILIGAMSMGRVAEIFFSQSKKNLIGPPRPGGL